MLLPPNFSTKHCAPIDPNSLSSDIKLAVYLSVSSGETQGITTAPFHKIFGNTGNSWWIDWLKNKISTVLFNKSSKSIPVFLYYNRHLHNNFSTNPLFADRLRRKIRLYLNSPSIPSQTFESYVKRRLFFLSKRNSCG